MKNAAKKKSVVSSKISIRSKQSERRKQMRDSINETKKAQNKSKKRVNTKEMLVKNKKNTKKLVLKSKNGLQIKMHQNKEGVSKKKMKTTQHKSSLSDCFVKLVDVVNDKSINKTSLNLSARANAKTAVASNQIESTSKQHPVHQNKRPVRNSVKRKLEIEDKAENVLIKKSRERTAKKVVVSAGVQKTKKRATKRKNTKQLLKENNPPKVSQRRKVLNDNKQSKNIKA